MSKMRMDMPALLALAAACAPAVHPGTAFAIAHVESGLNPHAIGVVGGSLVRQPRSMGEAIATINALETAGRNFSVGLAQINAKNFSRLGLTPSAALDPCTNLRAMQAVLNECHSRVARGVAAQTALRFALACYYGGNFTLGMRDGYVRKVVRASLVASSLPNRQEPL